MCSLLDGFVITVHAMTTSAIPGGRQGCAFADGMVGFRLHYSSYRPMRYRSAFLQKTRALFHALCDPYRRMSEMMHYVSDELSMCACFCTNARASEQVSEQACVRACVHV